MSNRQEAIDDIRQLIVSKFSDEKAIVKGKVIGSGVYKFDIDREIYTSLQHEEINRNDFDKIISTVPIKNAILIIENKKDDEIIFADMNNKFIRSEINAHKTLLYRYLDRIVAYAAIHNIEEVLINKKAFGISKEDTLTRIPTLDVYASDNMKNVIKMEMEDCTAFIADTNNLEVNTTIQGIEVRIIYWKNEWDTEAEVIIQLLGNIDHLASNVIEMFKSKQGFIIFNRDYSRYLNVLLNDKSLYKRIAYIDMQSMVSNEGYGNHFELGQTTIESLRNKDFDIYVVNMAKIADDDELLSLPSNKLVILVSPVDTNKKALGFINLFKSSPVIKNHIVENLIGIVAEIDKPIQMDTWSRELLGSNDVNLEELLGKLLTPFIIRDDVDSTKPIDINEEIKMMLVRAEQLKCSNIDIVPGSPIRFYLDKIEYHPYSKIRMTPILTEILVLNMIKSSDIDKILDTGDLDTSYSLAGVGRYRLGIVKQRSSLAISIRRTPKRIPSPEELLLPRDFIDDVVNLDKGITLIVGEPNSGKTLTFNCIMDEINRKKGGILFLLGNPIEYTHQHQKALVIQIEIGHDLPSYTHGIAKSLRMNTTTLGFEELRTQDEFAAFGTLINAPNSIFMTSHAPGVRQAIQNLVRRLHESGTSEEKAREDLANTLNYVFYQKLVSYNDKRVLIYEKLKVTPQIRALIRNGNFNQLDSAIISDDDCESLDSIILKRLEEERVDFQTVKYLISDKSRFKLKGYPVD